MDGLFSDDDDLEGHGLMARCYLGEHGKIDIVKLDDGIWSVCVECGEIGAE